MWDLFGLVNPSCALTLLVKIVLHDVGGQRPNLFNSMPHRHTVFEHSGLSLDGDKQEIFTTYTWPIHISGAVGADLMNQMLSFYGAEMARHPWIMQLSLGLTPPFLPSCSYHAIFRCNLALTAVGPTRRRGSSSLDFPNGADFKEGTCSSQINGGQHRFNLYMDQTHKVTYLPAPPH